MELKDWIAIVANFVVIALLISPETKGYVFQSDIVVASS